MASWVQLVVAIVGGGGPLIWLLTRLDKKNTEQHGHNLVVLEKIETKIDKIDDRLEGHIDWHMKKK